eukprot:scaffold6341_cov188-Prasinococcus_capsulatus_cf.AAC.1
MTRPLPAATRPRAHGRQAGACSARGLDAARVVLVVEAAAQLVSSARRGAAQGGAQWSGCKPQLARRRARRHRQAVDLCGAADGELVDGLARLVGREHLREHEAGGPVAGGAAPELVAHRDGGQRARVVVEAGEVEEARGLGHLVEVAPHAVARVVEPPGRAHLQRGVHARQRRQLARVQRLVQGEDHQAQARVRAVALQQRAQRRGELRGDGDVAALVRAVLRLQRRAVVAEHAQ